MKVLVTGAAGFIGMHLSQRLLARGDQVVGLDNLNDYYDPSSSWRAWPTCATSRRSSSPSLTWPTARHGALFVRQRSRPVVHLAAQAGVRYSLQNPHAYAESNLIGFRTSSKDAATTRCSTWCIASAPASMAVGAMPFSGAPGASITR